MNKELQSLISFAELTNKLAAVERRTKLKTTGRHENDSEHSYQLATVAWFIITKHSLKLDHNLCLVYALLHDLVEIHAGDTFFYADEHSKKIKSQKEAEALKIIANEFPDVPELAQRIHEYELRANEESKFIYALDKLLPVINAYLIDGATWREEKISLAMLKDHKTEKLALNPTLSKYFKEFIDYLETRELELFGTKS